MPAAQEGGRVFPEPSDSTDFITCGPAYAPEQFKDGMLELERRHGRYLDFSTIREEMDEPDAVSIGEDGLAPWHSDTGDGLDFYVVTVTDSESPVPDSHLRSNGESFAAWLGVTATRIPCGVSVGISESVPSLLAEAQDYLDQGYVRIKLKIEPGCDIEPVRAVRKAFGADLPLQVDANAADHPGDIPVLRQLDAFGPLLIEQPFAEERLLAHADLRAAIDTPVCLDESAVSAQVVAPSGSRGHP